MQPSSGTRLPGVEGLRAFAALSILVYHSWLYGNPGGTPLDLGFITAWIPDLAFGVTLFFSLSGFLLYRPFAAAVVEERPLPRVRAYARNRALRILPAYWVIFLVSALVLETLAVRSEGAIVAGGLGDAPELLLAVVFAQNYMPETVAIGIGPAWSLAVEVVFYARLAVRARSHQQRRLAALVPAVLLLCVGLLGKGIAAYAVPGPPGWFAPTWHSAVELSFWCQADLFAFGMALAVLHVEVEHGRWRMVRGWRIGAALLALGTYVFVARTTEWGDQLSYKPANTLMALACALVIALVVLPGPEASSRTVLLRALEHPVMIGLGLVSYSIFLWHQQLVVWLGERGVLVGGGLGLLVNAALLLTVTLALSVLTYRLVEVPALRLKSSRARRRLSGDLPPEQLSAAP
jgi:peptidoglycan/LPS O-acetylase OafA/YrhL